MHSVSQDGQSNPSLTPYDPPEPEFPFQYLCAIYFSYGGKEYCVVVDRYSHWPRVFAADQGARSFTDCLRPMFSTFGICQEVVTDGAKIFTGTVTQRHSCVTGGSSTACHLLRSSKAIAELRSLFNRSRD